MLEFRDKGEREKFEVELKEGLLKLRGECGKFSGEEFGFSVAFAFAVAVGVAGGVGVFEADFKNSSKNS